MKWKNVVGPSLAGAIDFGRNTCQGQATGAQADRFRTSQLKKMGEHYV
jgi:hypothetical protein